MDTASLLLINVSKFPIIIFKGDEKSVKQWSQPGHNIFSWLLFLKKIIVQVKTEKEVWFHMHKII